MGTDASKKVTAQKMTYQSAYPSRLHFLEEDTFVYLVTR
jgi:hypothetical protein